MSKRFVTAVTVLVDRYMLITAHFEIISAVEENAMIIPEKFALRQNYPNPFNASTIIRYEMPEDCDVVLTIFNLQGQKVRTLIDGSRNAGIHTIAWSGFDEGGEKVPTGVYFYRLDAGDFVRVRRMVLLE